MNLNANSNIGKIFNCISSLLDMFVKGIDARVIKDSRNENTIEIDVTTKDGRFTSSAPSGKSKGIHEAQAFSSRGKCLRLMNPVFSCICEGDRKKII